LINIFLLPLKTSVALQNQCHIDGVLLRIIILPNMGDQLSNTLSIIQIAEMSFVREMHQFE
jgi:hypothetical protein